MIQCQNCGQVNNFGSNFCRFCGTKMVLNGGASGGGGRYNSPAHPPQQYPQQPPLPVHKPQMQQQQQPAPPPQSYEYRAPRPYIWKTDEFQLPNENGERKTGRINQVQPLANLMPPPPPAPAQQQHFPMHQPPPPPRANNAPLPVYQQQQQHRAMSYSNYRCPHCGTQNFPYHSRKISTAGWIVFAVLLVTFFPLFWIGFLIKEDVKTCPVCNFQIA